MASSVTQQNSYGRQANAGNAAQAAQAAIQNFLKVAPRKYYTILGTIAKTKTGGSTSNVTWTQSIPIIPAFCTAIDYTIQLPVTLTVTKTTGSATLSAMAPYSGFSQQLTLGGAPPWPLMEMTPWAFDSQISHVNYDWNYVGLGNDTGYFSSILDQGPIPNKIGGTGSLNPGTTVTNTGVTNVNHTYDFTFRVRQQLQRKRHLIWGAIPMGDPENRPNNQVQLNALTGTDPELTMFTNIVGATTTAKTKTTVNVYAKYELAYIDLLPPEITQVPQPLVNFGLQVTPYQVTNLVAGNIQRITHRTAQIYTQIHHMLVNKQAPIRADYFGLWDDQDPQSARWAYDASQNTFTSYFDWVHRTYRRYFNTGHYVADFEHGLFPEIATLTPYDALMSPDASYAQTFTVPVTPAMTTAIRVPSGTSVTNAYCKLWSFGLVRVPY